MKNKRRNILAISLFGVAIAAGIVQYKFGPLTLDGANLAEAFDKNKNAAFGEAVLVSNIDATPVVDINNEEEEVATKPDKETEMVEETEAEKAETEESRFEQARIERDAMRSRSREQLEDAVSVSSDTIVSTEAQQSLLKLTETENLERKIESLLEQKGYKQTMVYIGTDESMDIVVNTKKVVSN